MDWRTAAPGDFAVIGDPVAHSWSPRMHGAAYAVLGLPYHYHAIRVPLGELEEALRRLTELGYMGLNVTVPLKEAAAALTAPEDPRFGAVNTIRLADRRAINTDVPGFLATLGPLEVPAGGRVLLLGAGGSARALAVGLVDQGYEVRIHNRTPERARRLIGETGIRAEAIADPDPDGADLIVNATAASLSGQPPALYWDGAKSGTIAYDLMYSASPTPFLIAAREAGLRGVDGRQMLVEQGALALEWWLGLPAPRDAMRQVLA